MNSQNFKAIRVPHTLRNFIKLRWKVFSKSLLSLWWTLSKHPIFNWNYIKGSVCVGVEHKVVITEHVQLAISSQFQCKIQNNKTIF